MTGSGAHEHPEFFRCDQAAPAINQTRARTHFFWRRNMSERDAVSTEIMSRTPGAETSSKRGITVRRLFTKAGVHPFDEIEWEMRTASIQNEKGKNIFEQRNVEVPKDWTQTATNIVASKYFHGKLGTPERESSVRQLISRVSDTIAQWGVEGGYFRSEEDAKSF